MQEVLYKKQGSVLRRIDGEQVIEDAAYHYKPGYYVACTGEDPAEPAQLPVERSLGLFFFLQPSLAFAFFGVRPCRSDFIVS